MVRTAPFSAPAPGAVRTNRKRGSAVRPSTGGWSRPQRPAPAKAEPRAHNSDGETREDLQ